MSRKTINLIWKLRCRFIEHTGSVLDYFGSLNGYYLKYKDLDRYLDLLDEYKYGNKDLVLSVCENFKVQIKGDFLIDINNAIYIVLEIFRNYYIYSIKEPKPFIPKSRNTKAYVYQMMNPKSNDFASHQMKIQRLGIFPKIKLNN